MTETNTNLTVTKLDAARRQLETAGRLYFSYGDPISIHTLSAAAYNVIRDINKKLSGKMMLKDMWQLLDTEDAAVFRRTSNEAENFLKHADRAPDASLDLDLRWAEVFLLEGSIRYFQITAEQPPLMQLFVLWFSIQHPNIFRRIPGFDEVFRKVDLASLPSDRREYFATFLPLAMQAFGA
jgi:hypothetical protein